MKSTCKRLILTFSFDLDRLNFYNMYVYIFIYTWPNDILLIIVKKRDSIRIVYA